MVLDGAASAVGTTLRISQIIYELKAVGEQTRDLLNSTKHISSTLHSARTLRRQKSRNLSTDEKKWLDGVLADTDQCLRDLAALVEPTRVDLQTRSGRIGLVNRGFWVFRDSPKVATSLARLSLTSQSLNSAMTVLCAKGAGVNLAHIEGTVMNNVQLRPSNTKETKLSPPTYNKSEFLYRRRVSRHDSNSILTDSLNEQKEEEAFQKNSLLSSMPQITGTNTWTHTLAAELEAIGQTAELRVIAAPNVNDPATAPATPGSLGFDFCQDEDLTQRSPDLSCVDGRIPYMLPDHPSIMQNQFHSSLPPASAFAVLCDEVAGDNASVSDTWEAPRASQQIPSSSGASQEPLTIRNSSDIDGLRESNFNKETCMSVSRTKSRGRAWLESQAEV